MVEIAPSLMTVPLSDAVCEFSGKLLAAGKLDVCVRATPDMVYLAVLRLMI